MAESANRKWSLPDQTTSPPDVAAWLKTLADAADNSFQWGPVGSVPATLPVGTVYMGY